MVAAITAVHLHVTPCAGFWRSMSDIVFDEDIIASAFLAGYAECGDGLAVYVFHVWILSMP